MSSRTGNILIVGGYGAVGRRLSRRLAQRFPGRIMIAGRDAAKAGQLATELDDKAVPVRLDVEDPDATAVLASTDLVVMCIDQTQTAFVEACLSRGVSYIDITANHDFQRQVENLDACAQRGQATAVLSVGLAPGVTNLLAAHVGSLTANASHVDIFVMLGLGEKHGKAAVRWTLDNLASLGDSSRPAGTDWRRETHFEGERVARRALRFNLPDQYIVPRTTPFASATTWLCFESRIVTWALGWLGRVGLLRSLRRPWLQSLAIRLLDLIPFGSDRFALQARAQGNRIDDVRGVSSVSGNGEAWGTAVVAALVVERLYEGQIAPGVVHVEQCFEPRDLLRQLVEEGMRWSPATAPWPL